MPNTTTHGLEFPLIGDDPSLAASDPATNQVGTFEKGWRKLDASAGHFYVLGVPEEAWITRNAVFTGTVWNREDTNQRADAIVITSSGEVWTGRAPAGGNPISWSLKRLTTVDGFIPSDVIEDNAITSSKIATAAVTNTKVSFPPIQEQALASDTDVTTAWTQILGVSLPEAGRVLINVQLAVRFIGSSIQTFNGSVYVGGVPVDPVVTLRTSEANYTASIPLTHIRNISGATSVTFAVSASANNSYQVVAQGTKLTVVYLPNS